MKPDETLLVESASEMPNLPAPKNGRKRVVIVGAGFAGLKLARKLKKSPFQVVLLDKNNFHQFQPLLYQVATSGLEPSSIVFPLRNVIHAHDNMQFRLAQVIEIIAEKQRVLTNIGWLEYDYLVLASGGETNFFGNQNIEENALAMKNVSEALYLRNHLLSNYEDVINSNDPVEQQALLNVVIAGGGPTGVELAGAISEMRSRELPKDFPELDFSKMKITLVQGSSRLLDGMSDKSGARALEYLKNLGIEVLLNSLVTDYDGNTVKIKGHEDIPSRTLIWAAGIQAHRIKGISEEWLGRGSRIEVNTFNQIEKAPNIFCIGDQSIMPETTDGGGHPQVAQVAIQQGELLARNLVRLVNGEPLKPFEYNDKGSMATIGRKLAVVDVASIKLGGMIAWLLWLFVHLMAILGAKNKLFIFLNWAWRYLNYDQSLRVVIRPFRRKS